MRIVSGKCNVCKKSNAECASYKVFKIFNFKVCQSCISKAFRGFKKGV